MWRSPKWHRAAELLLIAAVAGSAALLPSCAATPKTPANTATPQPPSQLSDWEKINWLQDQLGSLAEPARPGALVEIAELYIAVSRPEKAALSAREALYAAGTEGPAAAVVASRARTVLGGAALLRGDVSTARRELNAALALATGDVERSAAFTLLAVLEGRESNNSEAAAYRARVTKPSDRRVLALSKPFQSMAPVAAQGGSSPAPSVARPAAGNDSISKEIRIIPRARWNPAPTGKDTDAMGTPFRITVHHEGRQFSGATEEDCLRQVKSIQEYHQRGRKWADIAYHFIIDRLGNIVEGRSLSLQGAHAGERNKKGESPNAGNIGISLLGDYDIQKPTAAQEKSLRQLIQYLEKKYSINNSELYTHNEIRQKFRIGATGCPGKNLKPIIEQIRKGGLANETGLERSHSLDSSAVAKSGDSTGDATVATR